MTKKEFMDDMHRIRLDAQNAYNAAERGANEPVMIDWLHSVSDRAAYLKKQIENGGIPRDDEDMMEEEDEHWVNAEHKAWEEAQRDYHYYDTQEEYEGKR